MEITIKYLKENFLQNGKSINDENLKEPLNYQFQSENSRNLHSINDLVL